MDKFVCRHRGHPVRGRPYLMSVDPGASGFMGILIVTLAVRGADLSTRMSRYLVDRILADPRIEVRTATEITRLHGGQVLERITLTHRPTGSEETRACRGLFCFIGAEPATGWLSGVAMDRNGFIRTDVQLTSGDLDGTWTALGRSPLPFETSPDRVTSRRARRCPPRRSFAV